MYVCASPTTSYDRLTHSLILLPQLPQLVSETIVACCRTCTYMLIYAYRYQVSKCFERQNTCLVFRRYHSLLDARQIICSQQYKMKMKMKIWRKKTRTLTNTHTHTHTSTYSFLLLYGVPLSLPH